LKELGIKTFDFVTLIHVVEHFRNPRTELARIMHMLNPKGILFIETPNIDSHLSNIEKISYTFLTPPDHIHLFSPQSLKRLLSQINPSLECVTKTYSYPEHLVGILRIIKSTWTGKPKLVDKSGVVEQKVEEDAPSQKEPIFDKYLAPFLTPLLNLKQKGSILQLYVKTRE
jgi:hypothetical protein